MKILGGLNLLSLLSLVTLTETNCQAEGKIDFDFDQVDRTPAIIGPPLIEYDPAVGGAPLVDTETLQPQESEI